MIFEKKGKLSPHSIGHYHIMRRIGRVEYELDIPTSLASFHPIMHLSMLKKCDVDHSLVLTFEYIFVKYYLFYEEQPIVILNLQVLKLRSKEIALVKVLWLYQKVEEATWEGDNDMCARYPSHFKSMDDHMEGIDFNLLVLVFVML